MWDSLLTLWHRLNARTHLGIVAAQPLSPQCIHVDNSLCYKAHVMSDFLTMSSLHSGFTVNPLEPRGAVVEHVQ